MLAPKYIATELSQLHKNLTYHLLLIQETKESNPQASHILSHHTLATPHIEIRTGNCEIHATL